MGPVSSAQPLPALRNRTSAQCPLRPLLGFPPHPHRPPPHAHEGVWGWPICDRSEVSLGLGEGASQSGTGEAGHTVGFLSNWKPGAQQNPVNRLSGTAPAMTARPRQAGTFRCGDSLSRRSRVGPSNSRPPWNRWPWSGFWANFKELHNFTVPDVLSQSSVCNLFLGMFVLPLSFPPHLPYLSPRQFQKMDPRNLLLCKITYREFSVRAAWPAGLDR